MRVASHAIIVTLNALASRGKRQAEWPQCTCRAASRSEATPRLTTRANCAAGAVLFDPVPHRCCQLRLLSQILSRHCRLHRFRRLPALTRAIDS